LGVAAAKKKRATKKKAAAKKPVAKKKRKIAPTGPFAQVWAIVRRIPFGKVATYGQIAEMIGHRLSPVGIGWAIRAAGDEGFPWQRVVNSQGGISTDGEHPGLQRAMLEAEGVVFDENGRINLTTTGWKPRT
jgi:methylated-DNA-protein-cysteine methyltransferase related protein